MLSVYRIQVWAPGVSVATYSKSIEAVSLLDAMDQAFLLIAEAGQGIVVDWPKLTIEQIIKPEGMMR